MRKTSFFSGKIAPVAFCLLAGHRYEHADDKTFQGDLLIGFGCHVDNHLGPFKASKGSFQPVAPKSLWTIVVLEAFLGEYKHLRHSAHCIQ